MKFYFREEEAEYIRSKPKGWVRKMVVGAMASEDLHNVFTETPEVVHEQSERIIRELICSFCGGMTLAGRCQRCGRLQ